MTSSCLSLRTHDRSTGLDRGSQLILNSKGEAESGSILICCDWYRFHLRRLRLSYLGRRLSHVPDSDTDPCKCAEAVNESDYLNFLGLS